MAKLHQLKLCPSFLHTTKYEQDSLRHPRCMEKNSSQYLLSERAEIIFFFFMNTVKNLTMLWTSPDDKC